jgi:hypothetical protein
MTTSRFIAEATACALAVALIWLASVWPALAHMSPSGEFMYPPSCCNSAATSATGDCAPISPASVVARADGYHVTLGVGQHPKLLTKGYSAVIPYKVARPSEDGQFHVCLSTDGQNRYCFFAPPPGV